VSNPEFDRIATYYDHLVDRYGHDPRACDASTMAGLEIRYKVLSEVCDLNGMKVLEVGCGFGDLGAYLKARRSLLRYVGIDISPRMIEEARKCHPKLEFRCCNALELPDKDRFDVVLAQGVFYLLRENPEARTKELIEAMFARATRAVAFCAISSWAPKKTRNEYYVDPTRVLGWCKALTPKIVLRHDYLNNDVAVYMYKC